MCNPAFLVPKIDNRSIGQAPREFEGLNPASNEFENWSKEIRDHLLIGGYKDGDILRDMWDKKDPILRKEYKIFTQPKGTLCREIIKSKSKKVSDSEKATHKTSVRLAKKYMAYIEWSRGTTPTKEAIGSFYTFSFQKRLRRQRRIELYIIVKGFTKGMAKQTIEGMPEEDGHKIRNMLKQTFSLSDKGELDKLVGRLKSGDAKGDGLNFCLPRSLGGNVQVYISHLEKLRQDVHDKTPEASRDTADHLKPESIFDTLWAALPSTYINFKMIYKNKYGESDRNYNRLRQAVNQYERSIEVIHKREARFENTQQSQKIRAISSDSAEQVQLSRYIRKLNASDSKNLRACWDCGHPDHLMGDACCPNPGGGKNMPEKLVKKKGGGKNDIKKRWCRSGRKCRNTECKFKHPPSTDLKANKEKADADAIADNTEVTSSNHSKQERLESIKAFLKTNGFDDDISMTIGAIQTIRMGRLTKSDDPETIHIDSCAGVTVTGDQSRFLQFYDTPDTKAGMSITGVVGEDTKRVLKAGIMLFAAYDSEGEVQVIAEPRAYYCPGFQGTCVNTAQLSKWGWNLTYTSDNGPALIARTGDVKVPCRHEDGQLVLHCLSRSATELAEYLHSSKTVQLREAAVGYTGDDRYEPPHILSTNTTPNQKTQVWGRRAIAAINKKLYNGSFNQNTQTVSVKAFVYSKLSIEAKARLCHRRLGYTDVSRLATQTREKRGLGMDVYTDLNKEDRLIATMTQARSKPHKKKTTLSMEDTKSKATSPNNTKVPTTLKNPVNPRSKKVADVEYGPLEFWDVDGVGPEHIKAYFPQHLADHGNNLNTHGAVGAYIFSDRVTKRVIVKLYKSKSSFYLLLEEVIRLVKAQGVNIKVIRSDNAGELMTSELTRAMESEYDFTLQHSKPLDPASGGNHEKAVGDITRISRAQMLGAPHLPLSLWGVSMIHAATVHRVLAHKANNGYSPFEVELRRPPDIKALDLHVFGAPVLFGLTKRQRMDMALRGKHVTRTEIGYYVGKQGASTLIYKPRGRSIIVVSPNKCFYFEAQYASTPLGQAVYIDNATDPSPGDPIAISPLAKSLKVVDLLENEGYLLDPNEYDSDDEPVGDEHDTSIPEQPGVAWLPHPTNKSGNMRPRTRSQHNTYNALLDGGLGIKEFCQDIAGEQVHIAEKLRPNQGNETELHQLSGIKRFNGKRKLQLDPKPNPTPTHKKKHKHKLSTFHVPIRMIAPFIISALALANMLSHHPSKSDPRRFLPQPKNFFEALTADDWEGWVDASKKEYNSFKEKGVFIDTKSQDRNFNAPTIPLMEIYTRKWNPDGSFQKYKCRLVAWGQLLTEGVHYGITFAPTISADSVRMFLAIGAQSNETAWNLDVRTAYLHADQTKTLYAYRPTFVPFLNMTLPQISEWRDKLKHLSQKELRAMGQPNRRNPGSVWELKKSVYGIPDAGAKWNRLLNDFFTAPVIIKHGKETGGLGLKRCASDPCMYHKRKNNEWLLVMAWVDDVPFNGTRGMKEWFKGRMAEKFSIDFLGEMTGFLGMSIAWDKDKGTVEMTQSGMIEALCDTYRCYLDRRRNRKITLPIPAGTQLKKATEEEIDTAKYYPFPQLVGALSYLAQWTKIETQVAVNMLSQHLKGWSQKHWETALGVLEYLETTKMFGIIYSKDKDIHGPNIIYAYGDADLGADPSRRPRSGVLVMANGGAIFCKSSLQNQVQLSTAGAELTAQVSAGKAALGLRNILAEIGLTQQNPTIIYQDNQAAIAISDTPGSINSKSKYLDLKLFKMREWVQNKVFKLIYCKTKRMLADILSKNLDKAQFCYCRDGITGYQVANDNLKQ